MNLLLLGLGTVFIIDPVLGLHDYLPDFIGCFLIIFGIRNASYLVDKLRDAKKWFVYAAVLSIVRTAAVLLGVEAQTIVAHTLVLVIPVAECLVYIPAFRRLFEGFDYAAMRYGTSEVLSIGKREGYYYDANGRRQYGSIQNDTTGRLARFCCAFIVVRAIASVLPELPSIYLSGSDGLDSAGGFSLASAGNLIAAVTFVLVLIPAVVLFVRLVSFFRRVGKSGDFLNRLNEGVRTTYPHLGEMHTVSYMRLLSVAVGVCVLLFMGFYDYQMNLIPRWITAGAVAVVSLLLFFVSGRRVWCLIPILPAAATVPVSLQTTVLQRERYSHYKEIMLQLMDSKEEYIYDQHINAVDDEYLRLAQTETLEAVACALAVCALAVVYALVCVRHAKALTAVPDRDRGDIVRSLVIRMGIMLFGICATGVYFAMYRYILPTFDLAYMTGVAVNLLAVALFYVFSSQANKYVYENIY